jgi:N-acetylmuramoyl-L-alanine amidase
MEDLAGYLLKVSFMQTVFYLLYFFFFRNTSFFNLNRAYLLVSLFFSFVVPFIVLPIESNVNDHGLRMLSLSPGNFNESEIVIASSSSGLEPEFQANIQLFILTVYLSVAFVLLLRCCLAVKAILKLKSKGNRVDSDDLTVIHINGIEPFCFLNLVFVDNAKMSAAILLHEEAHVKYYHWVDLLAMELVAIICWFNPVTWFYKSALKQQHEYLADEYVVRSGIQTVDYLESILAFISIEKPIGPVNKFSSKSLKKRIVMMTKNKSSLTSKLFYLAAIPVLCAVLFAFSKKENGTTIHSMNKETVIVIDPAHGGSDKGSLSSTGLAEKDLSLSMASRIQKLGKLKGLNVMLTRSGDETITLNDRVIVGQKANADFFLSIHFGFDPKSDRSGIECYVSEENTMFSESQKVSSLLVDELKNLGGLSVNNVKSSSAFVLKENTVPAVVLELGYLSNEKDTRFISDEKNQDLVAEKIVASLLRMK